jgi:hypothetical protein
MARRLTQDQVISNVYYDLERGFGSIQETYKKAKAQDIEIILDDVRKFMSKQPNNQIKGYKGTTVILTLLHLQGLNIKLT